MTRHRTQFAREGAGYGFNSPRSRQIERNRSAVAKQNAQRVPCPDCGLMILPAAMHVHRDIVHSDDE